jgi:hypothetical protein
MSITVVCKRSVGRDNFEAGLNYRKSGLINANPFAWGIALTVAFD